MLDFSKFAKDFEAIAERYAFERLLVTNRQYRQQRVARMIAQRGQPEDNVFAAFDRDYSDSIETAPENLFA